MYADTDHLNVTRSAPLVFAAAAIVLLFPETRLTEEARSLASSSSPSITDDESDQQRMKGKWKIVRCEFSGQNQDQPLGVEDTIADGKWHRPKRKTAEYQFKLDPTKDPKWIDLTAARLGNDTLKGIYLLEHDKLTLCYAYDPDSPRPTEFKTTSGDRCYLYEFERVKEE